ncbi:MAG: hypothetical protein SO401_08945 [Blautia sp.]|nr:hypothetical protein [Blautia sp.]
MERRKKRRRHQPALVVNEKVVSMGKVLKAADVEMYLKAILKEG